MCAIIPLPVVLVGWLAAWLDGLLSVCLPGCSLIIIIIRRISIYDITFNEHYGGTPQLHLRYRLCSKYYTYLLTCTDCVLCSSVCNAFLPPLPPATWSRVVVVVAVFGGGIQYLMSIPFNPFKPIRLHCLSINSSVVVNKWLLANIEIVY